jgi:PEP-CTERM motif
MKSKLLLFPIVIGLLFVPASLRAQLLPGNFWVNSTFELLTAGMPDNWNYGGSDYGLPPGTGTICQVSTANSVSSSHSLAVIDNSTTGYGEWYSDVSLSGNANPGDTVAIQWSEIYNIDPGNEMRVDVRFLDIFGNGGDNNFVVSGNSPGWASTLGNSTFDLRDQQLVIPSGAVTMRIQLTSGGPASGTGQYIIDDLSVAVVPEPSTIALLSVGGLVGMSVLLRRRQVAR